MKIKKLAWHGILSILGSWLIGVALLAGCAAQPGNAPAATPMAAAEVLSSPPAAATPQPEPTATSEPTPQPEPTAAPTEAPEPTIEPTPEPEAAPSWQVYTAEELASLPAEELAKLRTNARFVMGVDKLDDAQFVEQMGGRIARVTTTADDSERTNIVIIDGQTDLEQLQAAITAAREQGLNLIGNMALYVTHDSDGVMRVWHEGTKAKTSTNMFIYESYKGLKTLIGFFTYSSETGQVTLQDLSKENYQLLGMGTNDDFANKRIRGPAVFEYRVQTNDDGSTSMIIVSKLSKVSQFAPNIASPSGGEWVSYDLPHMREHGEAEIMPSLDKVQVVLAELDSITGQQSAPDWAEAELQSYQGGQYLEVRDTTPGENAGKVAYLVYVDTDPTTGERQYGPVLLLKNSQFQSNSTIDIRAQFQPLANREFALKVIQAIKISGLAQIMRYNNILAIHSKDLPPDRYISSNYVVGDKGHADLRGSATNRIIFNSNQTNFGPQLPLIVTIGELFESLGSIYGFAGILPPENNAFFILDPSANPHAMLDDANGFREVLRNAHLRAIAFVKENRANFSEAIFENLISVLEYSAEYFRTK